jgi:hypothetical protein
MLLPAFVLTPAASSDPPPLPNPLPVIPAVKFMSVSTDNPYTGDRKMFVTVSPNGDGYRDFAHVRFFLTAPALVIVRAQSASRNFQPIPQPSWSVRRQMQRGWQEVVWRPSLNLDPTTYVICITLEWGRNFLQYGQLAHNSSNPATPIVRVLGATVSLDKESYAPGETAQVTIANDSVGLTLHVLDVAATDTKPTVNHIDAPDLIPPQHLDWTANRDRPATVPLTIGDWQPGVYFIAVVSDAGDIGYAPLIVTQPKPTNRVAVLIPDHTWFAYDFFDDNGDGFPDSWYYPQGSDFETMPRPFDHSGVPWQFNTQMWPFLRWLRLHKAPVDFLSEADAISLGDALAQDYDLIVVPTHLEYVTDAEYDILQHYRDAGGDLIFLSSNDIYWQVQIDGTTMQRVMRWRDLQRPESALVGAQYAGSKTNDVGEYIVGDAPADAWAFANTGLKPGDTFGDSGNEFDLTTSVSPPGTQILATVTTPYHHGAMTYYELNGAKVFDAGTFFTGRVLEPVESKLLENVWNNSDAPDLPPAG